MDQQPIELKDHGEHDADHGSVKEQTKLLTSPPKKRVSSLGVVPEFSILTALLFLEIHMPAIIAEKHTSPGGSAEPILGYMHHPKQSLV